MTFSGANAQNNTAGAIIPASVPGKPLASVPATNLNIGMDLWNASPASAGATKLRPNPTVASSAAVPATVIGHEGVMPEQWIQVRALHLFLIAVMYYYFSMMLVVLEIFSKRRKVNFFYANIIVNIP